MITVNTPIPPVKSPVLAKSLFKTLFSLVVDLFDLVLFSLESISSGFSLLTSSFETSNSPSALYISSGLISEPIESPNVPTLYFFPISRLFVSTNTILFPSLSYVANCE